MKAPNDMNDRELIEAIELAAPRANLADVDDLRKVAGVIEALALEAAGRLRDRSRDRVSRLEDAAFHFQTCGTCRRQGEDACKDGRVFAAFLRGELEAAAGAGPLIGSVRDLTIHADGRVTGYLTVNDAGARFVEQVRHAGGDPADGIGFRS